MVVSSSLKDNETYVDYINLDDLNSERTSDEDKGDSDFNFSSVRSTVLRDVQTGISPDEYALVEVICQAYEPLHEAVRKRGLDPKHIVADAWCVGHADASSDPTERICWPALYYFEKGVDDLPYARPIEGIEIRISLSRKVYFLLFAL